MGSCNSSLEEHSADSCRPKSLTIPPAASTALRQQGQTSPYVSSQVCLYPNLCSSCPHQLSTAVGQALSIPELLELILLQLPPQDLLLNAQRVNRRFREVIAGSILLQRALFFHPAPTDSDTAPEFNPLLKRSFPGWFKDKRFAAASRSETFKQLNWNKSKTKTAAYARKNASWRRMLVAQPPATALYIVRLFPQRFSKRHTMKKREFTQGVRMGPFYDLVQAHFEFVKVASFDVLWHMLPIGSPVSGYNGGIGDENNIFNPIFRELNLEESEEWPPDGITLYLYETMPCSCRPDGVNARIGPEFRSLAREKEGQKLLLHSEWLSKQAKRIRRR
jgi:hypothetical protein